MQVQIQPYTLKERKKKRERERKKEMRLESKWGTSMHLESGKKKNLLQIIQLCNPVLCNIFRLQFSLE